MHEFVSVHGVLARVSDPEIPNKSMSETMAEEEEERDVVSCTGATASTPMATGTPCNCASPCWFHGTVVSTSGQPRGCQPLTRVMC